VVPRLCARRRVPPDLLARIARGEPTEARWVHARREPTWGWFDSRVAVDEHAPAAHGPRRFEVPVRIGGVASALRGQFVPVPKRTGTLAARLLTSGELAPACASRSCLAESRRSCSRATRRSRDRARPRRRAVHPALARRREANLHSATFADAARLRGGASLALEPTRTPSRAGSASPLRPATAGSICAPPILRTRSGEGRQRRQARGVVALGGAVRIGAGAAATVVRVEGVTEWKPFAAKPAERTSEAH
jgi:hypothetical protein